MGYKRQYEMDAVAEFANMVKLIAHDHPEDAALQAYCVKVKLTAVMILTGEIRKVKQSSVLQGRLNDCRDCEQREGARPCMADGTCKYSADGYKLDAIIRHFGEGAFDLLERYLPLPSDQTNDKE